MKWLILTLVAFTSVSVFANQIDTSSYEDVMQPKVYVRKAPPSSELYKIKGLLDDVVVAEIHFKFISERECPVRAVGKPILPCEVATQGDLNVPVENAVRVAMIGFNSETIVSKRKEYANSLVKELTRNLTQYGYIVKEVMLQSIELKP